jgi:tetratricopeptide (TPR) repeat protein
VLHFQIFVGATPDNLDARLAACDRMVEITERAHLKELEIEARVARVLCLTCKLEPEAGKRDVDRACQLAQELGTARAEARSELPALLGAFAEGRCADVECLAQRAYEAAPEDVNVRGIYLLRLAASRMLSSGDAGQAVTFHEALLASYPQAVGLRTLLASAYATLGRREEAARQFDWVARDDFALLPLDINWLAEMSLLADAAVQLGDLERIKLVYDRLLPYAGEFFFFGGEACPGAPVAFWLGELATSMGRFETAHEYLARARRASERMGATLLLQYCALAEARLLLVSRGDARQAGALLEGVEAFARAHGLRWLAYLVDNALRPAGDDGPGSRPLTTH